LKVKDLVTAIKGLVPPIPCMTHDIGCYTHSMHCLVMCMCAEQRLVYMKSMNARKGSTHVVDRDNINTRMLLTCTVLVILLVNPLCLSNFLANRHETMVVFNVTCFQLSGRSFLKVRHY
jgi:hypothetical protein